MNRNILGPSPGGELCCSLFISCNNPTFAVVWLSQHICTRTTFCLKPVSHYLTDSAWSQYCILKKSALFCKWKPDIIVIVANWVQQKQHDVTGTFIQPCAGYLSWPIATVVWSKPSHGSSLGFHCLSFCLWWDDLLRGGGESFITVYLLHAWPTLKLCVGRTPVETGRGTTVSSVSNADLASRCTDRFRTIIWVTC